MSDFRYSRHLRLLRASEFERVFAARNSAANPWFTLYGAANSFGHPRLGVTVSRRVGNAVDRNRWKRLIRESFRLTQNELPKLDLICVARSPIPPSLASLSSELRGLAARLKARAKKTRTTSEQDSG